MTYVDYMVLSSHFMVHELWKGQSKIFFVPFKINMYVLWLDLLGIFQVQALFKIPFLLNHLELLWSELFVQYKHISTSIFAISSFYFLVLYRKKF